jgi:hypothetical protein
MLSSVFESGSQVAADYWNRAYQTPVRLAGGTKAMAGSLDAFRKRGMDRAGQRLAVLLMAVALRDNHERQSQCSISIAWNLTGVGAS